MMGEEHGMMVLERQVPDPEDLAIHFGFEDGPDEEGVEMTALDKMEASRVQWASGLSTFAVNRRENKSDTVADRRATGELKGPVDHDVPVLSVRDPE